jgi:hypothetical protein
MIIIHDNAVWRRLPNGAETQATLDQCATEIERLRVALQKIKHINSTEMLATMHGTASSKTYIIATEALVGN